MTRGLTGPEFDQLFQRFADSPTSTSVFRWEVLQHYAIARDEPSLVAFRNGTPRPERSVRTSPWLARIATSTAAGKTWTRVRHVEDPLTEYLRWEMVAFVESQAAGERILVDHRPDMTALGDFWVFDGTEPEDRYAIVMRYDDAGEPISFDYRDDDEGMTVWLQAAWDLGERATPLNTWLAQQRGVTGAA